MLPVDLAFAAAPRSLCRCAKFTSFAGVAATVAPAPPEALARAAVPSSARAVSPADAPATTAGWLACARGERAAVDPLQQECVSPALTFASVKEIPRIVRIEMAFIIGLYFSPKILFGHKHTTPKEKESLRKDRQPDAAGPSAGG